MLQRMLAGGLIAGFAAGLLGVLLHFAFVQQKILLGEEYETGAVVHFAGASGAEAHDASHEASHDTAHEHEHEGSQPGDAARNALTVLFTGLIYAGYGLVLVAGFALAEHFGQKITPPVALLWGIAGFVTFQLAPAMGLAPELPGTIAADLGLRQVWWLATVLATAAGLALLAYGRGVWAWVAAGALLAAPHGVGAPHLDEFFGSAPPELAAEFAARVLGVGLATWAALGWLAGRFWTREAG
ncbi:MAG: CbtA family protein [Rhodobacteraceae bacterium]|nr:CbtA family protein [Paracoccaceae bacterium]